MRETLWKCPHSEKVQAVVASRGVGLRFFRKSLRLLARQTETASPTCPTQDFLWMPDRSFLGREGQRIQNLESGSTEKCKVQERRFIIFLKEQIKAIKLITHGKIIYPDKWKSHCWWPPQRGQRGIKFLSVGLHLLQKFILILKGIVGPLRWSPAIVP